MSSLRESRRVLVTGAAGFLGSHLCDRLLAEGHRVWGLDSFDPYYDPELKRRNLREALAHPAMELVEGDVRDRSLLDRTLERAAPDVIVHLAAEPGVRRSFEDPALVFDVNVGGTVELLEAMVAAGTKRLVLASSSSVYDQGERGPSVEDEPADRPISPYAASKRAAELACHSHARNHGIAVRCMRIFSAYGPRQRPDLAVHKFTRLIAEGRPLPIYGDGSTARDYTYVDDVVNGLFLALADPGWGDGSEPGGYEVLNLGRGQPVELTTLVETLTTVLGLERPPKLKHEPLPPGDVNRTWASLERVRRRLGYAPAVTLVDGLARFVAWHHRVQAHSQNQESRTSAPARRSSETVTNR